MGGAGEMVIHGGAGCLVDGFNRDAVAGYVEQLVRNPEPRAEMGAAGRRRAMEMFSLDKMIDRYEQLYLNELRKSSWLFLLVVTKKRFYYTIAV